MSNLHIKHPLPITLNIKKNILDLFPYFFISFLILMPLLPTAIKAKSVMLLYIIYIFLFSGVIAAIPIKKLFSITILLITLPLTTYRMIYGKDFGLDDMVSFFDSNLEESIGFLLVSNNILLIVIPTILIILISRYVKLKKIRKLYSTLLLTIPLCLLLIYSGIYSISSRYPVLLYENYILYSSEVKRISDGYKLLSSKKTYQAKNSDISIHLVIGESSRADYYSICDNYKENATPLLEKLKDSRRLVSFCDTTSVALNTRYSLTSMLSSQPIKKIKEIHKHKNLVHAFKNFGFTVNVFENNSLPEQKNNIHKTLILSNFLPSDNLHFEHRGLDLDFIQGIYPLLEHEKGTLNIIHLKGNHLKYENSYPEKYLAHKNVTDYYRSVRYTDLSLSYLIDKIDKSKKQEILFYISDHGEYVNDFLDNNYGHGTLTLRRYKLREKNILKILTEIPFFSYMNKSFVESNPNILKCLHKNKGRPISQDNLFSTLLGIVKNKDDNVTFYDESYDVCSENFIEYKRHIYDSDANIFTKDEEQFIALDK